MRQSAILRAVLLRAARWLVVLALMLSIGVHWGLLQSVAWVSMVVTFSQEETLVEAVEKTFSGAHPCKICEFVQEGKRSDREQEVVKIEVEKKIVSSSSMLIPFAPTLFTLQPFMRDTAAQRLETPPVPPPRRTSV